MLDQKSILSISFKHIQICLAVVCTFFSIGLQAQTLAFPSAEGYGQYTTGGRGGQVLIVTSLADSGAGTLREAIETKGPRTIVFAVSGNIVLESELKINSGNVTIAGQTAPGEGICLQNYALKVSASNVIIRYIRVRMGDLAAEQDDAISITRKKDIILDHCTFSWGTDETATFYDNENFTLQWCIISESLNNSVHKKGEHGYGGIWGGKKASFHHNLLAHHKSRNPRFCGARYHKVPEEEIVDFRNNVIYNWKANSAYGGEEGNHNMIGNYYKPGPATQGKKARIIVEPFAPYGTFYLSGNRILGQDDITADNSLGVKGDFPVEGLLTEPIDVAGVTTQSADEALALVLAQAGASHRRDVLDQRIVTEVSEGTATYGQESNGIIDTQSDVGNWPVLVGGKAPKDKDQDGMSDRWEKENGLDPKDPKDHQAYDLGSDYTNIEYYFEFLLAKKTNK
ncbi:polysaccharide lyase family 1 protein [Reichenbachiella sp. MSK19-1]|uniref:pectate lyase family protein n=1 Tax=Reichenbachiella sp. MSK19-1 TaxID=1897631 RepID=UPI000E6D066F|nr:pectate lyase [Reichenbachiella sp. MSK19-1]RJE72750.1 pectate lyase [Reichenbachiella sp. MSK19-1]